MCMCICKLVYCLTLFYKLTRWDEKICNWDDDDDDVKSKRGMNGFCMDVLWIGWESCVVSNFVLRCWIKEDYIFREIHCHQLNKSCQGTYMEKMRGTQGVVPIAMSQFWEM